MAAHLERAKLLLDTHRAAEAEKEVRLGLEQSPEDRELLHTLCSALVQQEKINEAREAAEFLVTLAPNWEDAHLMTCVIELEAKHYKLAERAAQEARRLAPYSVTPRQNLAVCYARQEFWHSALVEAEAGLALSPTNPGCANIRSLALINIGDQAESVKAADSALEQNPENARSQLMAGWAKLKANDHRSALEHFSEALRLDPNNESARSGLVAAMKAQSPIYRGLLAIGKMSGGERRIIIIGGVIGYNILDTKPDMEIWTSIIGLLWVTFVMFVGLSPAFYNAVLMADRRGRFALLPRQRYAAIALVLCLSSALGWYLAGTIAHWVDSFWALLILIYAAPLTHAFNNREGWRQTTGYIMAALLGMGLLISLFCFAHESDHFLAESVLIVLWILLVYIGKALDK